MIFVHNAQNEVPYLSTVHVEGHGQAIVLSVEQRGISALLLHPSTVPLGTGLRRKKEQPNEYESSELRVPSPLGEAQPGLLNCFGRSLEPSTGKEQAGKKESLRGSISVSGKIPRAPYKRKLISKQLYR